MWKINKYQIGINQISIKLKILGINFNVD
jgi:hypothetical protein